MLTTVYRIENEDGRGPYQSGDSCWDDNGDIHPIPADDGLEGIHWLEFSCFASVEQLRDWFGTYEIIQTLKECDHAEYAVIEYQADAENVRHGGRQSLVVLAEATEIQSYPLDFALKVA